MRPTRQKPVAVEMCQKNPFLRLEFLVKVDILHVIPVTFSTF